MTEPNPNDPTEQPRLVSVLIATKDRPDDLIPCLNGMLAQEYPAFEVVILDQSSDDGTELAVRDAFGGDTRLHFLRSSAIGKSRALNRLLAEARGEFLAFTDDDTDVKPNWLSTLVAAFDAHPDAHVVFGQVQAFKCSDAADEVVHTPALYFDERRWLKPGEIYGMGANMGMRRSIARRIGEFDVHLGPGTSLPAAEEGDFIYRAHRAGARVLLEPDFTLVHRAWRSSERWEQVQYGYGIGDAAFAMKHFRCGDRIPMLKRILHGLGYIWARGVLRVVQRRNFRNEFSYTRGFRKGLLMTWRMPLDRRLRLFGPPADNPTDRHDGGERLTAHGGSAAPAPRAREVRS